MTTTPNEYIPPANLEEFNRRFLENTKVTGLGIEGTRQNMACPFCAFPGFMNYRIIESREAMEAGGTCDACGRSIVAEFKEAGFGNLSFEFVQTGGPPQPDFLPQIRVRA